MKYNSKIIIACDFKNKDELFNFLKKMGHKKLFLKLGMQILYREGFEFISDLKKMGHNIFIDLKINDIPNTCVKAIESLSIYKPDFITVHAFNSFNALVKMQKIAHKNNIKLLAVTVLTSIDENDLKKININLPIEKHIETLIKYAKDAKIHGIVSSAKESKIVKKYNLLSITPGIRISNVIEDDQKRIFTPIEAIKNGSDFLVIGRMITNLKKPLEFYELIENQILSNNIKDKNNEK